MKDDDEAANRLRESYEKERGAPFTDAEWKEAEKNLLAFFGLLAEWDARTPTPAVMPARRRPISKKGAAARWKKK